ncbi:multidrug ABC transporter ATPase [Alcanivorax hongdengensis A-11-3]|uniref:Multidrug ABC transporter ATPase n=1 Tax=Alcanivorax hongdengensis A-11-3 TaxID=1177179 RepID=L0WCM7_9GAMM|nr:ABC transporter ATP-binding protein [Alcanivorax hongdengensis]EKF74754.1 multidrug ABC transporter ATPase [Alcanivorax hongdengensis A-11-3]
MIQLENLTRRYGDYVAVSNLTCRIQPGEIVGLLGRNGAGKTTTMKMLTGALEPDAGQVLIHGRDMADHRQSLQRRIGYLPENCPVYPEMTVVEYLDYRATLLDVPPAQRMPAIRKAVRKAELESKLLSPISTLSRGYRQRVGVAQAIIHDPDIVILDEPTNGLDPQQIRHMRDLIRELARHATVIVSTHILQEVEAVCQHVLILRHGELVVDSPLADLAHDQQLLVGSDASAAQMQSLLQSLPGVQGIHPQSPDHHYLLTLNEPAEQVAPQVASTLVGQGHALFQLQPRSRDLEALFREVNDTQLEEQANA